MSNIREFIPYLDETPRIMLKDFLRRYSKPKYNVNIRIAEKMIKHIIRYYKSNDNERISQGLVYPLEEHWYKSLDEGSPDYGVYNQEYYMTDLWACWTLYSRKYMRSVFCAKGPLEYIGQPKEIVDLGCGIGYTTAALKQLYPDANVYGTNLTKTYQYEFGSELGNEVGFKIIADASETNNKIDLIFASEYFEHIQTPIDHILRLLDVSNPDILVIANSFGTHSIGHFNEYYYKENKYSGRDISRLFNKILKEADYQKLSLGIWNNKPTIWKKRG